jgi:large subunit ribosomal protein L10
VLRNEKEALVNGFRAELQDFDVVLVLGHKSLPFSMLDKVRREASQGTKIYKMKNRLAKKAFDGTAYSDLSKAINGECLLVLSDDLVSACKSANDFRKKSKGSLEILLGANSKSEQFNKDDIMYIATLPSLEELQSNLLRAINGIGEKLLRTVNEAPASLLRLMNKMKEKE